MSSPDMSGCERCGAVLPPGASACAWCALEDLGIPPALITARGLEPFAEPESLEVAEVGDDGREHRLTPETTAAWRRLREAAAAAGVRLFIVSAFRSIARQAEIVGRKVDRGLAVEDVLRVCAPPGFSEHHTGCALDLGTPGSAALELDFGRTAAFRWLEHNAGDFGFSLSYPPGNPAGFQYEPWHWRYGR